MPKTVSAIIPCKNEAKNIAQVLEVVNKHRLIEEIIVVNDGSTDKSAEIAASYPKVTLVNHAVNTGKTRAVQDGINKSKNDVILLLDADLKGLTENNITDLLNPVINNEVDVTLSMRRNSYVFKPFGIDFVSGERALTRNTLKDPLIWSKPNIGFGLEVLMNKSIIDNGRTYKSVNLPNVDIEYKTAKVGMIQGCKDLFAMIGEISKALPVREIWAQLLIMSKNRKP